MKKCTVVILMLFLLSGCAAEPTFETIADEHVQAAAAPVRQVTMILPEEAAVPASESEAGQLYLCDGYEILVQTLEAGNLDATVRAVTGFDRESLTLMQTGRDGVKRYDLVWSCVGEAGERLGRAAILDDGNYHYVLSVLADTDRGEALSPVFRELFESYWLV